ncbi:MAG: hypothetical protein Q7S22_01735 [Candidatus Micrarchaeota archaeon]|nr:hypothetical protein [Candidatus Micrarchaeota archaeon]
MATQSRRLPSHDSVNRNPMPRKDRLQPFDVLGESYFGASGGARRVREWAEEVGLVETSTVSKTVPKPFHSNGEVNLSGVFF